MTDATATDLMFRAHTRLTFGRYWYDVGFRGAIRLEDQHEGFWMDVERDVGRLDEAEDPRRLVCVSYLQRGAPVDVVAALVRPSPSTKEYVASSSPDGFAPFPPAYGAFMKETAHRMGTLATRAMQTALWRVGARGGPLAVAVDPSRLFWSADDRGDERQATWKQIPTGIIMLDIGLRWRSPALNAEIADETSRLLHDGHDSIPPVGHDLLREAWNMRESNPRGALVIAVAAAEVAVKQFVATRLPQTEWLLRNLPSPPLHKLVRDLLPTVPSRATGFTVFPSVDISVVRVLHQAVERRNALVHAGAADLPADWLLAFLERARDLLYLLDLHAGHGWAGRMNGDAEG